MTARDTSIGAYHQIAVSGLLSKRRWQVYATVFHHGPMTSAEAYEQMRLDGTLGERTISQSRARFTELRDLGVLREAGVRPCKITGRQAIQWEVTNALPAQRAAKETRLTRKELLCEIDRLRNEIVRLRLEITTGHAWPVKQ